MKTPEFYREIGYEDVGYMPLPLSSEDEFPEYIKEEAEVSAREVAKFQNENTFTFAFITDIHYAINHNHKIRFMRTMNAYKELCKNVKIDKLILGGDYTNEGCKEYKSRAFCELRGLIDTDYFPVNGNHDDGSIWDHAYINNEKAENHLTPFERYELFYNHLPNLGAELCREGELYYLFNDTEKKVRYVFLDTGDVPYITDENGKLKYKAQWLFAMSQKQIDWLINTALSFDEEGWSVAFFSHSLCISEEKRPDAKEYWEPLRFMQGLIPAYKSGGKFEASFGEDELHFDIKADFSKQIRADVIGFFIGDYHWDTIKHFGDVPVVITQNSVMYDKSKHNIKRFDGDKTEILFDVVTIDKSTRKIHIVRVGAGDDRETEF